MRRDNIIWGVALILFGVLFMLQQQGVIRNVFEFFWPLVLMLVGGWIVLNVFWSPANAQGEMYTVSLGDAKRVRYTFSHGAAQIMIKGDAPAGQALVGSSAVASDHKSQSDGDRLEVKVGTGPSFIPFLGPDGGVWRYQIANDVPVEIVVEGGASTFDLDLRETLTERIKVQVGASTVNVTLPARGVSELDIEGGAATFNLIVPAGTAARINTAEGFVSLNVDTNRFPESNSGRYESPDYVTNANRASITIKAGVGNVNVK
jgi:hypothetical protein